MSTIILVLTIISCITANLSTFFKKDFNPLQKLNALIYLLFTFTYIFFLTPIISYLKTAFHSDLPYIDIVSNLILLSIFIGALIITIGVFYKNENYQKYAYRVYDFSIVVFTIIMAINIFYSNREFVFMFIPLLVSSLLNLSMMINASENLKTNSSKILYFTANTVLGAFWIVCLVMFINKLMGFNTITMVFVILTLILSLSGLVFGLINYKNVGAKK